jgi:probable addiction module antidote protein
MSEQKIHISTLPEFDMASHLNNEEEIAAYLTMVIEEGDVSELAHALGVAARARGMSEVAKAAGISREALYKALRPNAQPRFETINRVCAALGVRLVAKPMHDHDGDLMHHA